MPAVNVFRMPVMCSPLAPSANVVGDAVGAVDTSTITELNNDRSNSDVDYYAPARRVGGIKRCFCPSVCPSVCRVHSE